MPSPRLARHSESIIWRTGLSENSTITPANTRIDMAIVLFVCTANIARSPMAAALFNKKMEEMGLSDRCQAQSAGTWGRDGYPAAAEAIRVMQARGMDISSHLSREVNAEIISAADLILTMERGHQEALQVEFPRQRDKIYFLTELVGMEYDIPDPYGGILNDFEDTATELETIVEKGVDTILRRACPEYLKK